MLKNHGTVEYAVGEWLVDAVVPAVAKFAVMASLGQVSFLELVNSQLTSYPSCWKQDLQMGNCLRPDL